MAATAANIIQVALAPNLNAILIFLICFGLLGYYLHNATHLGATVALTFAILIGGIVGAAVNLLMARLMADEGGRLDSESSDMLGRIATVSIPIRAGGLGEVIFPGDNGARRSLGARSAGGAAIARDADVVIVDYGEGIATVETWDAFLSTTGSAASYNSPPTP
jgi:hypothetical protein